MHNQYKHFRQIQTLTFGATGTEKSFTLSVNGEAQHIRFVVPNFTNAVTATLTVHDEGGYEVYNSTAKAKNASYWLSPVQVPLTGYNTVKVTLSGNAGGTGGDVVVVLYCFGWGPSV